MSEISSESLEFTAVDWDHSRVKKFLEEGCGLNSTALKSPNIEQYAVFYSEPTLGRSPVGLCQVDSSNCHIERIGVLYLFKSQGIGSKLLEYVVKELSCEMLSAKAENDGAEEFFRQNGMENKRANVFEARRSDLVE
jgi:ribosomal protein S18 acetylase RimI-like enzyme